MAQHAARVDRAVPRTSADALLPAMKLLSRFGLHLLAILLGIILMLPFYWALVSSLKMPHEVRLVPPTLLPTVPVVATTVRNTLFQTQPVKNRTRKTSA